MNRKEWIDTYQTDKTKYQANVAIKNFDKFLEVNMIQEQKLFEIIKNNEREKYETIQKLVNFFNTKNIAAVSIRNYWNFIKNWWWHNDVKTYKEDEKAYVKFPKIQKRWPEPLEKETIQLLIDNSNEPYKTHYLILVSSGMRINESLKFSPANIEWYNEDHNGYHPTRILLTPEITKGKIAREVFISKQASEHLERNIDEYLKLYQGKVNIYFSSLRKKLKLTKKYPNNKNYHVQIYAFKSYFMTWAEYVHDHKYSNAIGGHGAYLPQYNRLPRLKREQMYLKLEDYVTFKEKQEITQTI